MRMITLGHYEYGTYKIGIGDVNIDGFPCDDHEDLHEIDGMENAFHQFVTEILVRNIPGKILHWARHNLHQAGLISADELDPGEDR